jgi:hypothetical protein
VKAERQLAVARELVRGRSLREIQIVLRDAGHVNPNTKQAWSLGIIQRDGAELSAQWRAAAASDVAEAKGRQWAEIQEAKRVAWEQGDINQVRQLIKLEMELIGTEAPKKQEVRATFTPSNEFDGMSDDELQRELETLSRPATALLGGSRAGAADSAGADSEG